MVKPKQDKWKLVGHFGVDAGICWIGDPCYILHQDESEMPKSIGKDWGEFCDLIGDEEVTTFGFGQQDGDGLGVCVHTGWGDGYYPVYARFENGRVMQIYIDFDGE